MGLKHDVSWLLVLNDQRLSRLRLPTRRALVAECLQHIVSTVAGSIPALVSILICMLYVVLGAPVFLNESMKKAIAKIFDMINICSHEV